MALKGELGVTRIAEEVGLDKSSVYRILATLKSIGYVCQNPSTQGYANTSRFATLSGRSVDAVNRTMEFITDPFSDDEMYRTHWVLEKTGEFSAADDPCAQAQ